MSERARIATTVRDTILATWPQRFAAGQIHEDQALGADGLGLDSVEVVEVVFACEQACGVTAQEDLFTDAPLTIGRVIEHLCAAA